jgi:protein-glutamine gamma-glutamyltransferase
MSAAGVATSARASALNARGARIALLVAGVAAQFAVMPVLSPGSDLIALVSLLAIGIATVHLPLPKLAPGARAGKFKMTMAPRQAVAIVIIMLGAVVVLGRVNTFDANSKAAALATLLLVVQVAHVLALQTRREAALGCAIVIVMLSVGAAFAGDVTLLFPVLVALPAIAVTAGLLHRGSLMEAADVASTGGVGAIVRACVVPVALATVVGLVVFLVLPNSSHLSAHGRFSSGAGNAPGSGSGASGSAGGARSTSNPGASSLDLRLRGPLSTAAVFEAPASSPTYWQAAIFSDFDGTRWSAAGPLTPWASASNETQTAPADPTQSGTEFSRRYLVRVLASTPLDVVIGPGRPVSYTGPGTVAIDHDGTAYIDGGPAGKTTSDTYEVVSALPGDTSDAALAAASARPPTGAAAALQWRALPPDLPDRVVALAASVTRDSGGRFDAVNAVEDYLRTHEKYTLNSPQPARGEDAVDDFLFVSHVGFCEQFATAAVVMLRSQGIAARLVTGYVGGSLTADPGERVFTGADAHAWVQVFYPGIGWVSSDPTAGSVVQVTSPSTRQRIDASLKRLWHQVPAGRWGALGVIALGCIAGLGLCAVGRRWVRRRRRFAGVDRGLVSDGPILASYLRLDAALHGVERARVPTESLEEFARRLGGVVASRVDVAAAVGLLERETYGVNPPATGESAAAVAVFDRLRLAADSQPVAMLAPAGPRRVN